MNDIIEFFIICVISGIGLSIIVLVMLIMFNIYERIYTCWEEHKND